MRFYVNEDRPTGKARIHTVNSEPNCQPQEKDPKNGGWYGPIDTRQEAIETAEKTRLQVYLCETCNP